MIRYLLLLLLFYSTAGYAQSNIANNTGDEGYIFPKEQYADLACC